MGCWLSLTFSWAEWQYFLWFHRKSLAFRLLRVYIKVEFNSSFDISFFFIKRGCPLPEPLELHRGYRVVFVLSASVSGARQWLVLPACLGQTPLDQDTVFSKALRMLLAPVTGGARARATLRPCSSGLLWCRCSPLTLGPRQPPEASALPDFQQARDHCCFLVPARMPWHLLPAPLAGSWPY